MKTDETKQTTTAQTEAPRAPRKRTRKTGGIIALKEVVTASVTAGTDPVTHYEPVPDWPAGIKTRRECEDAYKALKLEGVIRLFRDSGKLEGIPETVIKFK